MNAEHPRVCVPLKETRTAHELLPNGGQFPGFCVPLSARCAQGGVADSGTTAVAGNSAQ